MTPGNFTLEDAPEQRRVFDVFVEGDREVKEFLEHGEQMVDLMLTDLTTDIANFAADRLRELAPGSIKGLVSVGAAHLGEPGAIDATAGVEPAITSDVFSRGLGSSPEDFPVYVDVGTGIHGEFERPIVSIPGNVQVFEWHGEKIFARSTSGQKAQHYSDQAYDDTLGYVPTRLALAQLPNGGT